ncbi:MAG: trypsin-like peptidase domain-containing protein [Actinomycetota bacterium]|nr:trypsin-like peptidase domain-containing protein [Actinomycetota bacterium]
MTKKYLKILVFVLAFIMTLSFTSFLNAQEGSQSSDLPSDVLNYEPTSADKVLMVQPAVCYITSVFYGYVLDPWTNQWSDYYYEAFGGTGFVVNPETGHIVTAGHVIDINEAQFKYDLIYSYLMDVYGDFGQLDGWTDDDWNWAYENIKVEGSEGPPYDLEVYVQFNTAIASEPQGPGSSSYLRAEVVATSSFEQRDIGIIRITPQTGRSLSSALLGDSSMIEIQDPVTMIGYPWTSDIGQDNPLNPTVTNGTISGKQMVGGTEWIQIQGDVRAGNSGGPVLDKNGNVIGIVSAGTDNTNNYIRPSNDIKSFLNAENKLGLVDQEWRTGLAMFRLKHFSEAIKRFDAVLNLSAGHLLAQEYKAKAQANMGQDVPLTAETTVAPVTEETTAIASETTASVVAQEAGLSKKALWGIIGGAIGGFILLAVIIILIIMLSRRGSHPPVQKTPTYQQTAPPQQVTSDEGSAEKEEEQSEEKLNYCPNCGAKVEDDQAFCSKCGNKLE